VNPAAADAIGSGVRRERAVLGVALVAVSAIGWAQLVGMAQATGPRACHSALTGPGTRGWSAGDVLSAGGMWAVMMLAMMLPVVGSWVLALPRAARERGALPGPFPRAGAFLLGYGTIWLGYSLVAATGQLALQRLALLSGGGVLSSPWVASVLLAAAGIHQLTPWRDACLSHCRSPMGFFLTSWREGAWGAFTMGVRHGAYCVGCCWALMALSFVFGVMNLVWMALVTAFLVVEKTTSAGPWLSRSAGVVLLACAAGKLLGAIS
jgi:predicted metal-binding membrane protein